ncbi:hypothetical protein BRARA_F01872 [Brassica rapa]|uniref:Uncharacterized protein n=1 Tax=Brassica campestris TaxID=3711 RepID=A0A397YZB1_BRACM|nr:hypothetical protein BRARA_F01872 [Brassica rapa]
MIGFLFIVSFLGLFSVVPLRKIMIVDFKLIYPSGTATAHHINSFHTPQGAKLTKKQVRAFGKFFSLTDAQKGKWYSPDLSSSSFQGLQGYNLFLKDRIPSWIDVTGYVIIAIVSIVTVPHIFPQLKWYHILTMYIIAPLVSTASDLMQDFKIGYMTLASPRSMFFSRAIGTAMGCVISPCIFWMFYKAFPHFGQTGTAYPAPYAFKGFSALPKHCLMLCYIFFAAAVFLNGLKDLLGPNWARFTPLRMAMAISFHIGGYFTIYMCVGSLILFIWRKLNGLKADAYSSAVASGLICGEGIWTLPSSVVALAGVKPPICMKFLSGGTNVKVDSFSTPS